MTTEPEISEREQRRERMLALLKKYGLSGEDLAELMHVSAYTTKSWLKPETSRSSNPVPEWAMELLVYKMREREERRAKRRAAYTARKAKLAPRKARR